MDEEKKFLEFVNEEFRELTIKLLAYKYTYYIESYSLIDDFSYDKMERDWRVMGDSLGVLGEGECSPCIDFDYSHPLAKEGIALANKMMGRK